MKYTIELTQNQATRVNDILLGLSEAWGYGQGKLKLKPCEVRNVEDTNEYKIGYKQGKLDTDADSYAEGYEKGLKVGATGEYDKGYNTAITDYNMMIEWMNDCPEDYEKFLFKVYNLSDCKIDKISLLYDIICSWDLVEVISEFQKWKEEKKQADEIEVGDIVRFATDTEKMVVTRITNATIETIDENGHVETWKPTASLHKWGDYNVADKLQELFEGK